MDDCILRMNHISLTIDSKLILKDVDFYLKAKEVCSIVGENGAGKSTLMKVLAGSFSKYDGEIFFNGSPVTTDNVTKSHRLGIKMIHQESQLIEEFTVEQNVFSGKEVRYKGLPFINKKYQQKKVKELLDFLDVDIDVRMSVKELNIFQRKMIEIARAMVGELKILILDEVTASFSETEQLHLFKIIKRLKENGVVVVFISHKIDEVLKIADRIFIIRDGCGIEEAPIENGAVDVDNILVKMAGEDLINRYPRTKAKLGKVILSLKDVSNLKENLSNISLHIRQGEIVGIAGLVGSGKSKLSKVLAGVLPFDQGEYLFQGKSMRNVPLINFIRRGIVYLSEDYAMNLIMSQNVEYNISLAALRKFKRFIFINKHQTSHNAKKYIKSLNLRNVEPYTNIKQLSRGTQQKVALSKWFCTDAKVYILDDPSVSLDIESKAELYNILNSMAHEGKAIFMVSSDLTELIGMCDRIYVMFAGKIVAEMDSKEVNSVKILQHASGKTGAMSQKAIAE